MKKIIGMVKGAYQEVRTYWHKPKPGEYVPYKEFTNYVVGVSGANSLSSVFSYLTFSAGCLLIGKIYELPFSFFAIVAILNMPLSYLTNPINMLITDNLGEFDKKRSLILNLICIPLGIIGLALYFVPQAPFEHILPAMPQVIATIIVSSVFNIYYRIFVLKKLSKKFGKFRPWVIAGLIPCIVSFALIIYLPFDIMPLFQRFWILHLLFSFYNLFLNFTGQQGLIGNVISPNSAERVKIASIGGFAFSLIPSLVQMILPVLAQLAGGFESINSYRIVFPPFVLLLSAMTLFLAFGVKERILVSKVHKAKVTFAEGAKHVLKNKNFMLLQLSGLAACISQGAIALNNVLFIYISRNSYLFGVYAGIIGTASIPGLLMSPWLIKKFGKKKLVLFSRFFLIAGSFLNYFALMLGSVWIFIIINYILSVAAMPAGISSAAMNADIWDELQLKSGERLDGMTGIFGMLQTPIMGITSLIIPAIYLSMGFTSDWNIFFVQELRQPIINITILFGAIVAIVGTIPFFFYDLTEEKHRKIIEQLKQRAKEEGGLSDEEIGESADAETQLTHDKEGNVVENPNGESVPENEDTGLDKNETDAINEAMQDISLSNAEIVSPNQNPLLTDTANEVFPKTNSEEIEENVTIEPIDDEKNKD